MTNLLTASLMLLLALISPVMSIVTSSNADRTLNEEFTLWLNATDYCNELFDETVTPYILNNASVVLHYNGGVGRNASQGMTVEYELCLTDNYELDYSKCFTGAISDFIEATGYTLTDRFDAVEYPYTLADLYNVDTDLANQKFAEGSGSLVKRLAHMYMIFSYFDSNRGITEVFWKGYADNSNCVVLNSYPTSNRQMYENYGCCTAQVNTWPHHRCSGAGGYIYRVPGNTWSSDSEKVYSFAQLA